MASPLRWPGIPEIVQQRPADDDLRLIVEVLPPAWVIQVAFKIAPEGSDQSQIIPIGIDKVDGIKLTHVPEVANLHVNMRPAKAGLGRIAAERNDLAGLDALTNLYAGSLQQMPIKSRHAQLRMIDHQVMGAGAEIERIHGKYNPAPHGDHLRATGRAEIDTKMNALAGAIEGITTPKRNDSITVWLRQEPGIGPGRRRKRENKGRICGRLRACRLNDAHEQKHSG